MLDVHVFEPVPLFLPVQLIEQCLLQVDPLNVEHLYEALVVALIAHQMKHVASAVVHVQLLMDDI